MELDLTFAHNYTIKTGVGMPDDSEPIPVHYYPDADSTGETESFWIEVVPEAGRPWRGMFRLFKTTTHSDWPTGAYACPNGKSICVVASGRCYFIQVDAPEQWTARKLAVKGVRILPEHNMLILRNAFSLTAYGKFGYLWTTDDLTSGRVTIDSVSGDTLIGAVEVYKGRDTYEPHHFELNLITGRQKRASNTR